MNTRVKVKVKNVAELLKLLEKDLETMCTLNLNLEVSKNVIKLLDNYCEDWDFVDDNSGNMCENNEKTINVETPSDNKNYESDKEQDESHYISSLGVKSYNDLATLVESIFKLYKNSPNIQFESKLFFNALNTEYQKVSSEPISIEHSLITMIIESYYGNGVISIKEAIEDTVEKLKKLWVTKELSGHPNTTSLTKILYGNGRS